MQAKPFLTADPQTPEEAVIGLLMQAGRRLRTRHPEDQVDPSTFPLAKQLMCHDGMRLSLEAYHKSLSDLIVSASLRFQVSVKPF